MQQQLDLHTQCIINHLVEPQQLETPTVIWCLWSTHRTEALTSFNSSLILAFYMLVRRDEDVWFRLDLKVSAVFSAQSSRQDPETGAMKPLPSLTIPSCGLNGRNLNAAQLTTASTAGFSPKETGWEFHQSKLAPTVWMRTIPGVERRGPLKLGLVKTLTIKIKIAMKFPCLISFELGCCSEDDRSQTPGSFW